MLDFSRQYQQVRAEILTAIEQVCDSQHFILGQRVQEFEAAAARFCDVAHALGCASGTDALWLALAAAEIGPGDAVVTTPFTFFSTVSSILRVGARPILVDIDPKTYNLDPAQVAATLKKLPNDAHVRAILPVHLYGQCADWDQFTRLQQDFSVLLHRRRCPGLWSQVEPPTRRQSGRPRGLQLLPHKKSKRLRGCWAVDHSK